MAAPEITAQEQADAAYFLLAGETARLHDKLGIAIGLGEFELAITLAARIEHNCQGLALADLGR